MAESTSRKLLHQPVEVLQNVGPKKALALSKNGVETIEDLLYYLPRRYLDRSTVDKISSLKEGQEATVIGRIVRMGQQKGRRNRFIVILTDDTAHMTCVWFSRFKYWSKIFNVGDWLAVSGKVGFFGGFQITHPDFDRLDKNAEGKMVHGGKIIPLYPSTEALTKVGLDSRGFRRLFTDVVKRFSVKVDDTIPAEIQQKNKLLPLSKAIEQVHFPDNFTMLREAKNRLKYDELFYMELLIALRKKNIVLGSGGISFEHAGDRIKQLLDKLPFELTEAQKRVLHEIRADMKLPKPMNRLLQGDVGSGKTMVGLITMLIAIENGYQAAIMAPTEILAEQHFLGIKSLVSDIGVNVRFLVGAQSKAERQEVLDDIANGTANIVVGTHALIQESVEFENLGLVIIDEQHRFGVLQRATLRDKGLNPDVLVMTATPIPRTLSMTIYGDLDVSILDELPKGRKPIKTAWRYDDKRSKIYQFIKEEVDKGFQAYIVFPLVEETEKSDLKAASDSFEQLQTGFFKDYKLGLLHGRMKNDEKDAVMSSFKNGDVQILISTTVIEVGVDVPNANVMVIEHAERFGLTQLHQLRGRVGRGSTQSYCVLVAYGRLSDEAKRRVQTMVDTNDGFKIAEVDLEIRGPGEFFGTKQSGLPDLKIADVMKDGALLRAARQDAFEYVKENPDVAQQNDFAQRHYYIRNYRDKYNLAWVG